MVAVNFFLFRPSGASSQLRWTSGWWHGWWMKRPQDGSGGEQVARCSSRTDAATPVAPRPRAVRSSEGWVGHRFATSNFQRVVKIGLTPS